MTERIVNANERCIDYRLNQLGIRVWERHCQLISKSGGKWVTLGSITKLPVLTPLNTAELLAAWADPIKMTAFQYMKDCPNCDLADVLMKKKSFQVLLAAGVQQQFAETCLVLA